MLRFHYPRLHGVCRRLLGNQADADDVAQEALISIARRLETFDRRSRFSTWAYRVAVNASLDEIRRRGRRPEPHPDDIVALAAEKGRRWGGDEPGSPEAAALKVDVDVALAQLPPDFRAAVVLRDLCQLDYAEIAEVLAIPPGTVRSRIARGRAALAQIIGNPSDDTQRRSRES